jgi:hypothetical protein
LDSIAKPTTRISEKLPGHPFVMDSGKPGEDLRKIVEYDFYPEAEISGIAAFSVLFYQEIDCKTDRFVIRVTQKRE